MIKIRGMRDDFLSFAARNFVKAVILVGLLSLGGCSTTPKPTPAPSSLASISINSEVEVLGKPQMKSGSEGLETILTNLGADWPDERKRQFQIFVEPINIQELVKQGVRKQAQKATLPVPVLESNAEAALKFSVEEYGFDQAFEGRKLPMMELKAELINSNGQVIWDDSESINRRDQFKQGVNVRSWSAYQNNPALMVTDFSSVIDILIEAVFENLKEDYLSGDIENYKEPIE